MSDPGERIEDDAPPAAEEIHLPGPTFLPLFMAVGITLGVIGVTISFVISIVGVVLFLVTLIRWLRETRRAISELPLDHGR